MGWMTEISILNDRWDSVKRMIREEPESFINEIQELMNGRPRYLIVDGKPQYQGSLLKDDVRGTQATVYQSHHADEARLYIAHRNSFVSIDPNDILREYGARLDDPHNTSLDFLERELVVVEDMVKRTKKLLKKKRAAREVSA